MDECLNFNAHSFRLSPKVGGVAAFLGRLLPDIGGPGNKVRYLYPQLIESMTLYGSSICAQHIRKDGFRILRRIQSTMAIRITRAYRSGVT